MDEKKIAKRVAASVMRYGFQTSRRGRGRTAEVLLAADQYETLNDAAVAQGIAGLAPGKVEVWYYKTNLGRDLGMGLEWCQQHDCMPNARKLRETHILLGEIKEANPEKVFRFMQGEVWSPRGEARSLVLGKGLHHTSISVGDIIKIGSKVLFCDTFGFTKLD